MTSSSENDAIANNDDASKTGPNEANVDPESMSQEQRRIYLIEALKSERSEYAGIEIPADAQEQRNVLRALMNVRLPRPTSKEVFQVQDAYLRQRAAEKGIIQLENLTPTALDPELYLWQGDITRLATDAIVNAANDQMMGCFVPLHGCIDNQIHTFAGMQLREVCFAFMQEQGHAEPTGQAKITYGFNLPARYIIHTVGPIVQTSPTRQDREDLASCYRSCLTTADAYGLTSIAFCCISTGEFHFPNQEAARIALDTVRAYKRDHASHIKVVFDVFSNSDRQIYEQLLDENN